MLSIPEITQMHSWLKDSPGSEGTFPLPWAHSTQTPSRTGNCQGRFIWDPNPSEGEAAFPWANTEVGSNAGIPGVPIPGAWRGLSSSISGAAWPKGFLLLFQKAPELLCSSSQGSVLLPPAQPWAQGKQGVLHINPAGPLCKHTLSPATQGSCLWCEKKGK